MEQQSTPILLVETLSDLLGYLEKKPPFVAAVFVADSCRYCHRFLDTFYKLAENTPNASFVQVNITEEVQAFKKQFDLTLIPEVFLFVNSHQVYRTHKTDATVLQEMLGLFSPPR